MHSEKSKSLLARSCRLETASHLCGHIGFLLEQGVNFLAVHYIAFVVNEVTYLDDFFPMLCGVRAELLIA